MHSLSPHSHFITVLTLVLLSLNIIQTSAQPSDLKFTISNNKVDIEYKNTKRLTGGLPRIESQTTEDKLTVDNGKFVFGTSERNISVLFKRSLQHNTAAIYLSTKGISSLKGNAFIGMFFSEIPDYKEGIAFYRYKPWNSWTKPTKISSPDKLEAYDNQCYYWQYKDNTYGVMIPINGYGYRTTLGSSQQYFGSKAISNVDGHTSETVPSMVIGFGEDLYALMADVYETAMEFMGTPENLVKNKKFPEPLEYIGWCTWNASALGSNLNEETVINGVNSFTKNNFPLGWVLIDDGWFDQQGSRLRSMKPDPKKFPQGFRPLVDKLKNEYHLKHVGVWHALNGYWNGLDPTSPLGERYRNELFSWTQPERVDIGDSPEVTYYFIKPDSDSLKTFYYNWHAYLKSEGFSFIKVDNQLVVERMSANNYPIQYLAKGMHSALNESAGKYFNNAMINCMDMTSDAYYNFGSTAVARSVEDYFPYEAGENYNLQRGNAAAHVLQGVYNNLYFSQMVFPDLDMFQSHNPNGEFHAIARALNNGPIYITDNVGEQNFSTLNKLVLSDGRILRSETPLLPTKDCLFQMQDKRPFKAFSQSNGIGLLGVWNCADADEVAGSISPADVHDLNGEKFIVYEHFSGEYKICDKQTVMPVSLKRMKYALYYIAPIKNGMAPLGLLNKYNAPATIKKYQSTKTEIKITLLEGGKLGVIVPSKPKQIFVNKKIQKEFIFNDRLLTIHVQPENNKPVEVEVKL
jgi:raffinose synthase